MSETPPSSIPPPPVSPTPAHPERLYQVAAWVAIIAGVLLIAVVALRVAWFLGC
ncbi:hypothetical protein [Mycobacterium sp.]|uniref:hypothetical protein n=1 Tax=Mycobacterium sp. TaxID=1785 RepID=UPI003C71CE32